MRILFKKRFFHQINEMIFFKIKFRHIFVGPIPILSPSGQSTCFYSSFQVFDDKIVFDSNIFSLNNLFRLILIFPISCFLSDGILYFTGSRSFKGFLRDLWVVAWGYWAKKKIINHVHGIDFEEFYLNSPRYLQFIIDFVYSKISTIVAPGDVVFRQFSKYTNIKFEHVDNFCDLDFSTYRSSSSRFTNTNIIFLSNISLSKGIVETIEVCQQLNRNGINVTLDICGDFIDGEMSMSDRKKIIDGAVNSPYIRYHGYVSNAEKISLLYKSSIMLHPTSKDLAPLSIIEGLSSGCYVISTNTGSIRQILDGYFSEICEKNVSDITKSVQTYISQPISVREKMAIHNMNKARVQFSLDRYQSKIISLFQEK